MKRLLPIVALLLAVACGPLMAADQAATTQTTSKAESVDKVEMPILSPTDVQSDSSVLVANLMTRYHYQAVPLDDTMSRKIFDAFLDGLDSQRVFFTQKDIDEFAKWRDQLDDAIWEGNLEPAFTMFNRYRKSVSEQIGYARSLLKKGFDFSKQESFQLDRSEADWPADKSAVRELWRKRVKNDWLRLKLADKEDKDIRELLDERYAGYLKRVGQIESEDVFQTFMNAYAASTDPHTSYMGPRAAENFAIAMKLSLEGIGAVLEMRDDYTQIREIVPGGPADKSKQLHPGDRIVGVAQGEDGAMQNVVGWRLDDVVQKIRGKKGTVVRLEILPAETGLDGVHQTVTMTRDKVSIVAQAAKKSVVEVDNDGKQYKIGVIELPSFYQDFAAHQHGDDNFRSASRDVAKLIGELKQAQVDALIMDLRGNGGGSLSEATRMTGLFIDQGPVVQVRDWRGKVQAQNDDDPGMIWTGPLAVMVNRGSASASEIFTAAIQDYGRGLVIGSDTFGKGTVQNLVDLDNLTRDEGARHGELKMTIAQFFRVDGGSTQLRGVTPDIVFPSTIDKDDFGESSYKNALEWTSIAPAHYKQQGDAKAMLTSLRKQHEQRVATDPEWQLRVAQLKLAKKMRDRTMVSLNLDERKQQRVDYEEQREALVTKYRGETEPAASSSVAASSSAGVLQPDDGLQANERSLKEELAREAAAEKREDVRLNETAHILADEVAALRAKPTLADKVLPAARGVSPVTE